MDGKPYPMQGDTAVCAWRARRPFAGRHRAEGVRKDEALDRGRDRARRRRREPPHRQDSYVRDAFARGRRAIGRGGNQSGENFVRGDRERDRDR